ncbi:ABC transporter permease [Actinomadura syzygii]|uniref:ABC transporter permease n=1 Tax=Actinomadura syzygii TaxID=1427538 RepID=A0A5D0U3B4_9ACTN|nr:ABC transporter permease [Actinomadura syzygii]TYC13121.1 ABC transporter permease [Actinomadura syzygii]
MSRTAAARRWRWQRLGLNVLAVLVAVAAWHVAALWKDNLLVFPTPGTSLSALRDVLSEGDQRHQLIITLRRVVVGFALGSALGVVIGSLIGSVRSVALTLEPVVHFLRSVTPVAWIVPATIWLGVGEGSLRFIVVYATVFPVTINTLAGLAQVPVNKVRMARTFGASRLRIYRSIIIPSAVPYIVTGMRLSLGYSFMSVVAAEMVAGRDGIGYLIYNSRIFFDTATMFAGILLLGAAGLVFDKIFSVAAHRGLARFYAGQVNT